LYVADSKATAKTKALNAKGAKVGRQVSQRKATAAVAEVAAKSKTQDEREVMGGDG